MRIIRAYPQHHNTAHMQLHSKLPEVSTTIFTVMSKMAQEYKAINLGQGFPDFNADPVLLDLVSKAMSDGYNQYPYMPGIAPLREVVADKVRQLYGHSYDPDTEITITSGATQAIMACVIASVGSGDEVVVIEPCYDSYLPSVRLAGAIPIRVQMEPPSEQRATFWIDWQKVRDAVSPKTRLIMLNTPHNPTGSVLSHADLDALVSIVKDSKIMVLSDEVYEHIVFDGQPHLSLASIPELAERAFVISSFGKTTHTTGWKVGYCCAPRSMTTELRKIHQFMVFGVPTPFQHALAAYTRNPETYLGLPTFYQKKRDLLAEGLSQTRFQALPCPGTFFMLADYSQISDLHESEFSIWMAKEHGVVAIPVSAFYAEPNSNTANNQIVRFCFAKKEETLQAAIDRLKNI